MGIKYDKIHQFLAKPIYPISYCWLDISHHMPMSCGFFGFPQFYGKYQWGMVYLISSYPYFMFYSIIPNQECQGFFQVSNLSISLFGCCYVWLSTIFRKLDKQVEVPILRNLHLQIKIIPKSIHHKWCSIFSVGSKNQTVINSGHSHSLPSGPHEPMARRQGGALPRTDSLGTLRRTSRKM